MLKKNKSRLINCISRAMQLESVSYCFRYIVALTEELRYRGISFRNAVHAERPTVLFEEIDIP